MILEFEEPKLQTLPGLMSPASSLTMSPKAQQFDWRKRKECCAPEDEGKGNKDYRPREGEEAVSQESSLWYNVGSFHFSEGSNLFSLKSEVDGTRE